MSSRPFIEPYVPPSNSGRAQVPGGLEAKPGVERFVENMKKSPLPITKWGIAGAVGGTLIAGPYGGAVGVLVGL
eukprot:CAMPEP_0117556452 /NCGR_PEP_ID=MMETSP0784-20121206/51816_1 /TAXON_ID=39447 /ORGANISM="" /LENGTH=73 /DNA_ID=CAMNT_0005353727 /DNA_START=41 /DNA_END=258 /DNA_ORIENTATION=+